MDDSSNPRAVVEALYSAFADGDEERMRALLADDLRWRQAAQAVPAAGADREGADALIEQVVRPLTAEWDDFVEEIDELFATETRVTATGTYRGVFRLTGRRLTAEFCHLWTVEDGRITTFRQYTDTAAFATATTA